MLGVVPVAAPDALAKLGSVLSVTRLSPPPKMVRLKSDTTSSSCGSSRPQSKARG